MGGVKGILSKALDGRGGESAYRWVGHSEKHWESGNTPDEEASMLPGKDQPIREDDVGLLDKNDDILRKQLRGYKETKVASLLRIGFSSEKLAVSPPSQNYLHTLRKVFDGSNAPLDLEELSSAAALNDQYQSDSEVPRAGILKNPEMFLGGGFNEAGPTLVGEAHKLHDQGPDVGADTMANYRDEQAMKTVKRDMKINKKAALLLKQAMVPPMSGVPEETPVPHDEDPDFRRISGRPSDLKPTVYQSVTRTRNQVPSARATKTSADATVSATTSTSTPASDFAKRMRSTMQNTIGSKAKPKKTKPLDIVREETTSSPSKVPRGYSEMDPKVPDAPSGSDSKLAYLLKKCFK